MPHSIRSMRLCHRLSTCSKSPGLAARPFSSSSRLQSPLLDSCCGQTFWLMSTLHSTTGLSWVYVLPITAVAIRSIVVVPLSIWSRVNLKKLRNVQPLLLSWMIKLQRQVRRENPDLHPKIYEKMIRTEHKKKSTDIRKHFGISTLPIYAPLMQIPFFLVAIETIRQMCTEESGILGRISSWISGEERHAVITIQDSLGIEGALWFQDLLQPDPYYILPVALSGMLYGSIVYNERVQNRILSTSRVARFSWVSTVLKVIPFGMLTVTPHLPAAMLLYWVSSSAFALTTTFAMEKLMPIPKAMVPCRPPVKPYMKDYLASQQNSSRSAFSKWVSENL